jgi:hypothetical protein
MTEPPIQHMLVLRNQACGHVRIAAIDRRTLQEAQATLVTILGRRDFRIETVTADQAATALMDLAHGVRCATCEIDLPETRPEGP